MSATASKKASEKSPPPSGLDLSSIGDLSGLLDSQNGGPLDLSMDLIDEDPNQPRTEENPGFQPESLEDLATTIRLRGVKTPISVRENLAVPGRYVINHGARRFRSSKLAGKESIPAFIDNDYNQADQIIENIHRDELTAREIADYVGRELAKGEKKGEIAKTLGKSPSFVTQHVTLLDLPDPIAKVFSSGRCQDVTVINELVTAYKKHPSAVTEWLSDENQELTRGTVKLLREWLDEESKTTADVDDEEDWDESGTEKGKAKKDKKGLGKGQLIKPIVQVRLARRSAQLVLTRRPTKAGWAWFKFEDEDKEFQAAITDAKLVAIVEGKFSG